MDTSHKYSVHQTLREAIPPKHVKVMGFIITSSFLIGSLFYVSNICSLKPLIFDMITKQSFTTAHGLEFPNPMFAYVQYILKLIPLEFFSFISYTIISFLVATATIRFANSWNYYNKDLSLNGLLTRVAQSSTKSLAHLLLLKLYCLVFLSILAVIMLLPLSLFFIHQTTSKLIMFVLVNIIKIIPLQFSAIWVLNLVTLVNDEIRYGIEELCKGGGPGVAKRLVAFFCYFCYYLVLLLLTAIIYYIYFPRQEDFYVYFAEDFGDSEISNAPPPLVQDNYVPWKRSFPF